MAGKSGREISAVPSGGIKQKIFSWEGGLVLILLGVIIFGAVISSSYSFENVFREMPKYLCEIFMVFAMGYILIIGEIDISVGAIVCLSATLGVFASNAGAPVALVVLICIAVGFGCGCLNGFIMVKFKELPSMIVTLGTQIIFRGIAEVSLGSGGSVSMTNSESYAALSTMVGPFPLVFFFVIIAAVIFIMILSKTTTGKNLYAIGSNKKASLYAGVKVQKYRFTCFMIMGLMAGICATFYISTTYAANTTAGMGYEMEVIAMCVFGGIATTGGKGTLIGAIIAGFTIVCLRIALGQRNINTQLILVIIGILLIVSVLIPSIRTASKNKKKKLLAE